MAHRVKACHVTAEGGAERAAVEVVEVLVLVTVEATVLVVVEIDCSISSTHNTSRIQYTPVNCAHTMRTEERTVERLFKM